MAKRPVSTAQSSEAEARTRRRRRALLNQIGVGSLVLLVVVGAIVLNLLRDTPGTGPVDAPEAGRSSYGLALGDPDAPTAVVVYEDFACPFCGDFEEASGADLARLAREGKVRVDYRPIDLLGTDYSRDAALAFSVVLAEDPETAQAFHALLFAEQPSESGPFPDTDWYAARAAEVGADEAAVRAALEEDDGWVERATREAEDAGVEATPTILVDGEVFTDYDDLGDAAQTLVSTIEEKAATIER